MASKTSTSGQNSNSRNSSKSQFSYTPVLIALLAVGAAYVYFDRTSTLNKFSVAMTEKLCDMLPKHDESTPCCSEHTENTEETVAKTETKLSRESLHNPKIQPGGVYNAKEAMQMRYDKIRDKCNKFADVMRPESYLGKHMPKKEAYQWDSSSRIGICNPYGVGKQAFEALFMRSREADDNKVNSDIQGLKENFKTANKLFTKAVIVRHPMERLLSVFRKHFAAFIDPTKQESQDKAEGGVSFSDFVHLVVNGPKELAEFIAENRLEGQSLGIDTGMVDAKGESQKWDSYWHLCGVCHPDFKPHYILDFAHAKEDEEVLVELMGNKEKAKQWLQVKRNHVVNKPEVIEHFYSQLTKDEIMGIYEKYRVDFELFGYTPDYFLQFGQE